MALFHVLKTEPIYYYKNQFPTGYQDVHYRLNFCPFNCPEPPNNATGCDNDASNELYYYVYYPTNFVDYSTCSLPALIIFHSGGFSECSSPDQDGLDYFCTAMAARGFVVFSVSYRVGVLTDPTPIPGVIHPVGPKQQRVSAQQMLAIYRACQDARGAIRSIILGNPSEIRFKINTNYVFVGGMSAGSLIAMNAVYYQSQDTHQAMIDAVFPNISSSLGSINPDFYYAPPPILPSDDYLPNIAGVLNLWGSMFIPKTDLAMPYSFFSSNRYKPPIISFAGVQDPIFDIHSQPIYFSLNTSTSFPLCGVTLSQNFGKETHCLISSPYISPHAPLGEDEEGIGSETIYHMFDDNSTFAELYLDCEMGHGLDTDDPACGTCTSSTNPFLKPDPGSSGSCIQCSYQSNFGTRANSQMLTFDYIAGRTATFFQAIITSTTGVVGNKKFVEQINNRYGCGAPDNPTSFIPNTCDGDTHQ